MINHLLLMNKGVKPTTNPSLKVCSIQLIYTGIAKPLSYGKN